MTPDKQQLPEGRAMRFAPLCDASHSTRFAVFALRVAAAIAKE